jgi:hypothetical protein
VPCRRKKPRFGPFMPTFEFSVVDEEQQMNLLLPDREIDRDIQAADSFVPINE